MTPRSTLIGVRSWPRDNDARGAGYERDLSALISPFGNEALVLLAVQKEQVTPCLCRAIIDEYAGVLTRPKFNFAQHEIDGLIGLLQARGLLLEPLPAPGASPDPYDEPFIACALAAGAEFLVTGNKRHFPRNPAPRRR